jgi:hypothetical protein
LLADLTLQLGNPSFGPASSETHSPALGETQAASDAARWRSHPKPVRPRRRKLLAPSVSPLRV